MATKIITGALLASALLAVLIFGPVEIVMGLMGLALILAMDDFTRLPGGVAVRLPERVVVMLTSVGIVAAAFLAPIDAIFAWIVGVSAVGAIASLLAVLFTVQPIDRAAFRTAHSLAGIAYVGELGSFMMILLRPEFGDTARWVFLTAAVVTWLNDTMAYFGGKLAGRHKMAPNVSPNKTWEGSVTGMIGSVAGVFIVKGLVWHDAPVWPLVTFALLGGALGQVGDLVESLFKRSYGVKDSGGLLPGHGGALDRIDAFLFVAPTAYVWFHYFFRV